VEGEVVVVEEVLVVVEEAEEFNLEEVAEVVEDVIRRAVVLVVLHIKVVLEVFSIQTPKHQCITFVRSNSLKMGAGMGRNVNLDTVW